MDEERRAESHRPSLYTFEEILEPLAQLGLCGNAETDKEHSNNREPDEEADRSLDNSD